MRRRRELETRVKDALSHGLADRIREPKRPRQLSGGQQQRVALARAIVCRPKVLLLDEPLSALDAKLRQSMQLELRQLHQQLGITFIFVTHDQSEALTMSDRVAVMNQGKIEQIGPPQELYNRPQSIFVANFVGQANILHAEVIARDATELTLGIAEDFTLKVESAALPPTATEAQIIIRPEKIRINTHRTSDSDIPATITDAIFTGPTTRVRLRGPQNIELIATTVLPIDQVTSNVFFAIPTQDIHILPAK